MESNKKGSQTGRSIGFSGVLTIAFIVLKLLGVINWPWIWVLAPAWITAGLWIIAFAIVLIIHIKK